MTLFRIEIEMFLKALLIQLILLLTALDSPSATVLTLSAPSDYQVIQRQTAASGDLVIRGSLADINAKDTRLEARMVANGKLSKWRRLAATFAGGSFQATIKAPAGGWYQLEVRAARHGEVVAQTAIEHLGVGEVFVVAGQSNAANHGEERQTSTSGRVAAFDGQHWQLCNDPQPGASGNGGSFLPPFGDAISRRFNVPVGIIACGIGATSVREWLPIGVRFPNPPTLMNRVRQLPDGGWESNGQAFDRLAAIIKQLGAHGCRGVLWHQGESDANQTDSARTLPGALYRDYLERIIRESRRMAGWEVPWFVAQVSYHVPGDEGSTEIRTAQASLWRDHIAFEGPDTDALKGPLRENGGRGVHFSGPGLRLHAACWVEKVAPCIEKETH